MTKFVIQDQHGFYLGVDMWTKHRPSAVAFPHETDAHNWLDDRTRRVPNMFRGRECKIVAKPIDDETLMPARLVTDHDPYGDV